MMGTMEPVPVESCPIPPADLILRVSGSFGPEDIEAATRGFNRGGRNNLAMFERAVAAVPQFRFGGDVWLDQDIAGSARSLSDFDRLLDFGCGCGRLLRHMSHVAERVEIHGTDIDADMIAWLQRNMPFGRYQAGSVEPPLPYRDDYFDLVISHSVFTHLDERQQDMWLRELQRITRPGALLLISVQGQSTWQRTLRDGERSVYDTTRWRQELERRGILFIANDGFVGSTHPECYHSTIHTPQYVFEHWSQFFDISGYIVEGAWAQDLVVLERPSERSRMDHSPAENGHPTALRSSAEPAALAHPKHQSTGQLIGASRRLLSRVLNRTKGYEVGSAPPTELQDLAREVRMMRTGLYEQGQRISVLAAQLREEIRSLHNSRNRP